MATLVFEVKANLENANRKVVDVPKNSYSNSFSVFSAYLDWMLESTKTHHFNITTSVARLGNNLKEAFGNVEENVKSEISSYTKYGN